MKGLRCLFAFLLLVVRAWADDIGQWTFNSVPPDGAPSTGTTSPSFGTGVASLLNGINASFSDGSTNDPASGTDDSGWQTTHYPPQATSNRTAGVQFNVSTVGYSNIVIRWDQRTTGTASKYFRLLYTTDGVNFTNYPTPITAQIAAPSSPASYYEAQTNSLAAFPDVNDNPNFAFQIVSEWESSAIGSGSDGYAVLSSTSGYSTAGNVRFDFITVSGTLIPGANTAPSISALTNQTMRVNQSTGPQSFMIFDAEDPAGNLTLNATSSNPGVIPGSSVVFGGANGSRTVGVDSGAQTGSATITVWVIDTGGKSNASPFTVTVLPANTSPVISAIPATNTLMDTPISPLAFTVGDAETSASSLTLSALSANTNLVANNNLSFGGSGSNRTVTVSPLAGQIGVAPIIVTVSDGTNTASSTFGVMVRPSTNVLLYDPFEYADGSVISNSGFLWDNHTGAFGECLVTNGQLQITTSQTEDVAALLTGGPYLKNLGTVLYAGFKANFQTLPKTTPDHFAAFVAGSSQVGRVYAGRPTNSPAGTFRLFVANGSTTNPPTPFTADLNTNTDYTIVTRYNIDTATTTLWLNPSAESDPGVTATDPQNAATVSAFLFRQDSGLGTTILIDEIKVGLSFASVTSSNSISATPIPLDWQRVGGNLILSWSNPAFSLQAAPSPNAAFTDIPAAASPYTNPISGPAKFFRLRSN